MMDTQWRHTLRSRCRWGGLLLYSGFKRSLSMCKCMTAQPRHLSNRLVMMSYPSNRSIVDVATSAYSRVRPSRSVFRFLQYVEKQK